MLQKITKWLSDWFGAKAFESELKRQLINDVWLRQTYICVNLYLNNADYAKGNLASYVMQTQMTDDFRKMASRAVGLQLLEISKSKNRQFECRSWIISLTGEYAALRALYTPASTYESEVLSGIRHESTSGLYESFQVFAPRVYAQYFPSKTYQGFPEQDEELRHLSIAYQFWFDIGNIARIGLDDKGDWPRRYLALSVAFSEAMLKGDSCRAAVLSDERESLKQEVLSAPSI